MNDRDLRCLLDDAANSFEPTPSHGRLALALAAPRATSRRLYVVLGVAAGLTALGAGAAAMTGAEDAIRSPSDGGFQVDVSIDGGVIVRSPTTTVQVLAPADRIPTTTAPDTTPPAIVEREVVDPDLPALHAVELVPVREVARLESIEPKPEPTPEPTPEPRPEPKPEPTPEPEAPKPQPEAPKPEPKPEPEAPKPEPPTTEPPQAEPPPPTDPPHEEEEPPPTTVAAVDFTARQLWGSCDSDPPYDEFKGHATPGTGVWIGSEFGEGFTEADGEGKWYLKVFFETAPLDEPFTVVLESSLGHRETFTFVRTG